MNKVVLVTGSSRGIGRATAIEFAKNNYDIVINYNSSENKAKEVEKEIKKYGVNCITIKCDISNEEEVKNMVNEILNKYNKIDVLVNNAAVCFDSLFDDKTTNNFKRTMEVNVLGTFLVSKYVGKIMYDNKYGKIINLSSTNGINTYFPMCIDYDASKASIISLTHNLAIQFAPYVNVNAVAPGWIDTDMNKDVLTPDIAELEANIKLIEDEQKSSK